MSTAPTFPSTNLIYRRADLVVHLVGLALILGAGGALVFRSVHMLGAGLIAAVVIYVACALASNLASTAYHFAPWHARRQMLRRLDHAAIYLSITGTFTPFFVVAGTPWTIGLLVLCWALTVAAVWNKLRNPAVKSRWSTASYLGLGALGLCALPQMGDVPIGSLWLILAGAAAYVIGTGFYVRKSMPFRYAIWHAFVDVGAICMFLGIWLALFPGA